MESDGSYRKTLPRDRSYFSGKQEESETRRGSIRKSLTDVLGGGDRLEVSLAIFGDSNSNESEGVLKIAEQSGLTAETDPQGHSGGFFVDTINSNAAMSSRKRWRPRNPDISKLRGFFNRN